MKKINKQRIGLACIASVLVGFFIAKITPESQKHGLSSIVNTSPESSTASNDSTEMSQTETIVKQKNPEQEYIDQVNNELTTDKYSGRLAVPLMLQTDSKWENLPYGIGNPEEDTLGINGCAIVSLAMVASFLQNREVLVNEVLDWSGNDYFLENEGTAWAIFYDFAQANEFQYEELGDDMFLVQEHLKQEHPLIVSVKPGFFTTTGHVMVVTGTDKEHFWINDPNDNTKKKHSVTAFSSEQLSNEALNFWAIYN